MAAALTFLTSLAVAATGVGLWASQVPGLEQAGALNSEPNPLGLKKSAYGEVIAMALQGPIDEQWTSGVVGRRMYKEEEQIPTIERAAVVPDTGAGGGMSRIIKRLEDIASIRTNRKSASEAHKREIRRNIENRLRFAYEFDPSNFGNYNSYHFFITQPQLGLRPRLTQEALLLAEQTIKYCATREDDPRPSLTAAAAAENILQLMFERGEQSPEHLAQMRGLLAITDHNLARYRQIAAGWEEDGIWRELSLMRQTEAEDRYHLTQRLRAAAAVTVERLEPQTAPHEASQ
jgi:hypothetical protein